MHDELKFSLEEESWAVYVNALKIVIIGHKKESKTTTHWKNAIMIVQFSHYPTYLYRFENYSICVPIGYLRKGTLNNP